MQRDRFRHSVHGEVTEDVTGIWSGLFHAAARKRDLGKFLRVEKFLAAQVDIALGDTGIDALHLNRRRDRRFLRIFAIDLNRSAKFFEAARDCGERLFHFEGDS